jgi:hypothetical protein
MRSVAKPYEEIHKTIDGILHKQCSKCEEWFPCTNEYFYKNKSNKADGLHPYCKKCTINKTLTERDPKRVYELNKIYRKTKPQIIEARKRANKKRVESGKYKKWQKDNPDKLKGYKQYRELHKKHELSDDEWEYCKNYFNYRCAYCGITIENHWVKFKGKLINGDFHRDHANHLGENDISNCIPACKSCNGLKHNFELNDWYNPSNPKFTQKRLEKIHKWLNGDYKLYINKK